MTRALFLLLLLLTPLPARIYADFSLSSGGIPLGTVRAELAFEKAPRTCANFIGLATGRRPWIDVANGAVRTNTPFYDGLTFHRLIHDFVIQAGSPDGLGTGGPGFTILDEYHPDLTHSSEYVLSMAKSNAPNTGSSQFFITLAPTPFLDYKHSVFGKVISGQEILNSFKSSQAYPTDAFDEPLHPITINSVSISGPDLGYFDINNPGLLLPRIFPVPFSITPPIDGNFTLSFHSKRLVDHAIYHSEDLLSWTTPVHYLSRGSDPDFSLVIPSEMKPRRFVSLAAFDYYSLPLAPMELTEGSRTIRLQIPQNKTFDLKFTSGSPGTWNNSSTNTSGAISFSAWSTDPETLGFPPNSLLNTAFISAGKLTTTLENYPSAGKNLTLRLWLSFRTPESGWTEEVGISGRSRFPFSILPNLPE